MGDEALYVRDGRIMCHCYACGGLCSFQYEAVYVKTQTRGNQVFCLECEKKVLELEVAWELME